MSEVMETGFDRAISEMERSSRSSHASRVASSALLEKLPFTDLYMRVDERGASRYKIGANAEGKAGLFTVPDQYQDQIDLIRSQIEKLTPDEGAITMDTMRLRYCRAQVLGGETWASLRRIPLDLPYLDGLFMNVDAVKLIRAWASRRGIILIGGATGAGKTTTAVATINTYLETRSEIAITIEDPPEYHLQGVIGEGYCYQFQVENEADWSNKVKAALRWRPRYILIGEIRTPDAAAQALRASTSGHLVISTVHGGSVDESLGAVLRLAEASLGSAARLLLSDNLVAVLHQRLSQFGPDINIVHTEPGYNANDEVRKVIANGTLSQLKALVKKFPAERG